MELSTLQVYNISHFFFPLQAQSHMKNSGEKTKQKTQLFFPVISEEMGGEGVKVEVGEKRATQQAPKSKIKKKNPNKNTHTENGTPAHELKKKQKKKKKHM